MSDPAGSQEVNELRELARRLQLELDGLNRRLERLEQRELLKRLTTESSPVAPATPPVPASPVAGTVPGGLQSPAPARSPPTGAAIPQSIPTQIAVTTAAPRVQSPVTPTQIEGVEARIGRVWMNRIGALVLLLGVGFFVKYSFDQGWISPMRRVLSAGATGLALIITGELCIRRRMDHFAVGLLGAGIAILYTASFAAYHLYHLIGTNTAFLLLCGVTALSTLIAVRGNLPAIAILGIVGGFWTPIALSTGQNRQIELLTYVLILDIGFLLSALIRRWQVIRVLGWVGTLVLFGGWYLSHYEADALHRTLGFAFALFIVFHVDAFIWASRRGGGASRLLATLVHANNAVFFASFYFLARTQYAHWMGLFCVLIAALQWLTSWIMRREAGVSSPVRMAFILDGAALLALAVPIQFDRYMVPVSWAAQAVVTYWFCRRIVEPWLRIKAAVVLAAAASHLVCFDISDQRLAAAIWSNAYLHLNWLILLFVGVGVAACVSAMILSVHRLDVPGHDRMQAGWLLLTGNLLIFGIFAHEYDRYVATDCWLFIAAVWLVLSRRMPEVSWLTCCLALAACAKYLAWDTGAAAVSDEWQHLRGNIFNRAVVTGLATAMFALCTRPLLQSLRLGVLSKQTLREFYGPIALPILPTVLALFLITWTGIFEILRIFRYEPWRLRYAKPGDVEDYFITGFLTLNAAALWLAFGLRRVHITGYALTLTLLAIIKFILIDTLGGIGVGWWESLTGIATNHACVTGLAVIALGYLALWYTRVAGRHQLKILGDARLALTLLILTTATCVWLPTFEILRVFRFEEFRLRFDDPNLAMHVALSVFWGLSAIVLLSVGFGGRVTALRYMAIALFGLTILKVFIIDLSHLQMVYRIVSFIVLGVLLLLGSFLYQKLSSRILPRSEQAA